MAIRYCAFDSPDLVTAINGATPTFAFAASNNNYLALQGHFISSTANLTPLIVAAGCLQPSTPFTAPTISTIPATAYQTPSALATVTEYVLETITDTDLRCSRTSSQAHVTSSSVFTSSSVALPSSQPSSSQVIVTSTGSVVIPSSTLGVSASPSSSTASFIGSTRTSSSTAALQTLEVSPDATCGGKTGYTCQGSKWGNCCSQYGWCGNNSNYCASGCQPLHGSSNALPSTLSTRVSLTPTLPSASSVRPVKISTDGKCGGAVTCQGSKFGNCCSSYGYCGSTPQYCGAGCNPLFGTCKSSGTPGVPALKVSRDTKCGESSGQTCQGSSFGNCCSSYGWCGSTTGYCSSGCQSRFGSCTAPRAVRDSNLEKSLVKKLAPVPSPIHCAGPDYTYPPIPETTVFVTTIVLSAPAVFTQKVTRGAVHVSDSCDATSSPSYVVSIQSAHSSNVFGSSRASTSTVESDPSSSVVISSSVSQSESAFSTSSYSQVIATSSIQSEAASSTPVPSDSITPSSTPSMTEPASSASQSEIGSTSPMQAESTSVSSSQSEVVSTSSVQSDVVSSSSSVAVPTSSTQSDIVSSSVLASSLESEMASSSSSVMVPTGSSVSEAVSFVESSTTVSSPSSASPGSSTTPTPTPITSERFCLKVLNRDRPTYNYLAYMTITQGTMHVSTANLAANVVTNAQLRLSEFSLNSSGQLKHVVPVNNLAFPGFLISTAQSNFMRSYRGTEANAVLPNCAIRIDVTGYIGQEVLKCNSHMPSGRPYTEFRVSASGSFTFLYGSSDVITDSSISYLIELCVFKGADCV
ncbi:hypothetical protein HBI56_218240 [Parastagonospora nodorum]|nr:hypothetical protein HBH54_032910 [Parastagonospora nodorum]KAH3957570.1 hypothetical protein HBH51_222850 [Parastagonospora nodorum]KAH3989230.1 hypothetical protein HBH52_022080 [Parastagonospora nodorum]KAH4013072.1 hypothetical protein HBI09_219040 [Parastagonospora nodorum]KAH4126465.1 hypothetical protein HBH45_223720 [Parastagonospora nodorum]